MVNASRRSRRARKRPQAPQARAAKRSGAESDRQAPQARAARRGRAESKWRVAALAPLALLACAATATSVDTGLEHRIVAVADAVKPSVVHIEAIVKIDDRRNQVTGSGLIVTPDGAILTNEHVVDRAEKITVSVPGRKRKYPARLVGSDRQTDIALLRIRPDEPLPAAELAEDGVRVGQWVLAVGNPYGLDGTVSLGIVSAKGRNLDIPNLLNDFIQTDAMIDRGSSGGPLVDLGGRVVGINSRGQGRGIGFTIPIATARAVMAQLEAGGIERGYLGVTLQPFDRELADYFGVPDATGVLVNHVVADSPAERGGFLPGDVLTRFHGVDLEAEEDEDLGRFQRLVADLAPGTPAAVEFLRDGAPQRADVVIGAQPKLQGAELETELGFHVEEITAQIASTHRLDSREGAFVTFVAHGSPAEEAGLRVADVVVAVDERPVRNVDELQEALASRTDARRFLVRARRGEELVFLLVKPGPGVLPEDGHRDADAVSAAHEAR